MQPSIQKIDFGVLGSQFNLSELVTSRLEISFSDLMRDYEGLANSFQDILSVFEFPKFVLPWATREVYTAANALELLQPIEDTEDDSATEVDPRVEIGVGEGNLVELLGDLDPSLVQVYTGALTRLCREITQTAKGMYSHPCVHSGMKCFDYSHQLVTF